MQLREALITAIVLTSTAEAWSPSNGYAPANVSCPDDINLVRRADGKISPNESDWLQKRNANTEVSLKEFLERATKNFSDTSFMDKLFPSSSSSNSSYQYLPKIGIGCSGGGYRAMLAGAGMLSGFDNRTDGAWDHGLGGILQSATYLAGLSGGNWLVGTLAGNNWTSVQAIVNNFSHDDSIWDIDHSIVSPGGWNILKTGNRWDDISDDVHSKKDAGFNISFTDVWGRALAYNWFPSLKRGGVGLTWDTLRESDVFINAEMPFPMSISDGRYPDTSVVNLNATLFEFNPFELGSWDPTLNSFTDVKYLGSNVDNGKPVDQGKCVGGYDNTGFMMGTSSSLFNQFLLRLNTTSLPKVIKKLLQDMLDDLADKSDDIAIYQPNPFKNVDNRPFSNYSDAIGKSDNLYLVDGGEDNENIPLVPLLQKGRDLDVIFALDNSADTDENYPDGASLVATYERQFGKQGANLSFPYVPDVNTFVNLGLNQKPTFFGCDAKNLTKLDHIPPLIVYIPNSKYSYNSGTSTFKMSYDKNERISMIQNGFEVVSRGNLTIDSDYLGCVACAIIRRKQESLNFTLPSECTKCFSNYCWNGTLNSTTPNNFKEESDYSSAEIDSAASVADASLASTSDSTTASSSSTSASASTTSSKGHKDDAKENSTSSKNAGVANMESFSSMSTIFIAAICAVLASAGLV
ncbi:hypothetical protein TBLA_0E03080 [Henningerozyma blattae CBS 6284]|uniref:Lysophospholipase n=1 Tax=Henningerozyma blattae (strain ATCC 34711 / CBS 6284 / DSM 70876 / NBRC 10599 / NRRL Y-10934 / UCD 77-7) TaxID=1071380 RepID=I2H4R0_HENB6|nr:hypothetical protein TBLA_0E03080 [Tetrapisispora blattae CBS 6284]CCH61362.1 hypothetical protein TBLA_0E03080 [Tetrapisispora blattae CBS 6284]